MEKLSVLIAKMLDVAASEEFTDLLVAISELCVCASENSELEFVALWNLPCREPLYLRVKSGEKPTTIDFNPEDKSYFIKWTVSDESGVLYFVDDEKKFILPEHVISAIEIAVKVNVETSVKKVDWGIEAATRTLSIVHHNARNVFGTISGVSQLLEMDEIGNERICSSLNSINEVIANYDISSRTLMLILRNEPLSYEKDFVELSFAFNAVLNKNKRVYAYSQIDLEYDVEDNITTIGDEQKIMQIFSELLLNASDSFENSDKGGIISVKVFSDNSDCVISVKDTGFGIDYDSQRYLTTKFFTRKFKRPGLGLTKVRRFVEDWGGRFIFSSEPEKGTFVEVRFPTVH
jgi:signal transduction histidine kinase